MSKNKAQHDQEHQNWSRRQFLLRGGLATAGSLLLGGTKVTATVPLNLTNGLMQAEDNDRVLVFINLFGGNDGLNMIIPHSTDTGRSVYEFLRPELAQHFGPHYDVSTLLSNQGDNDYALPLTMSEIMPLWNNGRMSVIQNLSLIHI